MGKRKWDTESVKDYIQRNSKCELVSSKYESSHSMLMFKCECGNLFETSFNKFRSEKEYKRQCNQCSRSKLSERFRDTYDSVKQYVEENSASVLLSESYTNAREKLTFCCACGNIFQTSMDEFKRYNITSCHACSIKDRSGTNAYNYNPNLTEAERLHARHLLGEDVCGWAKSVYKRDKYTCAICHTHSHNLNAHHLNGWSWDVENRLNIDNGITLCTECHRGFHKTYGYKNNTKLQFEEYAHDRGG